jgi:hypothetical protein
MTLAGIAARFRVFRLRHSPRFIEAEARKAIEEGRVVRVGDHILFDGGPLHAYKPLFAHLLDEADSGKPSARAE